jgi:hypothetical protein
MERGGVGGLKNEVEGKVTGISDGSQNEGGKNNDAARQK